MRVLVTAESGGLVAYDSGNVTTSQPMHSNTIGTPLVLKSDTVYSWTVTVWPADTAAAAAAAVAVPATAASQTSLPYTFVTGLLHKSDWKGSWIRGAPATTNITAGLQMRKDFEVASSVTVFRATLFIAACQYYTVFLDGVQIGDQMLDGPWTNFYTNRSYATHSIDTSLLKPGTHALGLRIGQGESRD